MSLRFSFCTDAVYQYKIGSIFYQGHYLRSITSNSAWGQFHIQTPTVALSTTSRFLSILVPKSILDSNAEYPLVIQFRGYTQERFPDGMQ